MSETETSQQPLDIEKALELYSSWCLKNSKSYVAPDLNKTEFVVRKGKKAILFYAEKGYKLALISDTKKGLSVIWVNWSSPIPRLSAKDKRLYKRYLQGTY